jgi:hypothetical protein
VCGEVPEHPPLRRIKPAHHTRHHPASPPSGTKFSLSRNLICTTGRRIPAIPETSSASSAARYHTPSQLGVCNLVHCRGLVDPPSTPSTF